MARMRGDLLSHLLDRLDGVDIFLIADREHRDHRNRED